VIHAANEHITKSRDVAVCGSRPEYNETPPFHPHEAYPECPFRDALSAEPNGAYEAVRGCFKLLGLDLERFGTPRWNPLGTLVRPGDSVVIKPNFVRDFRETQQGHENCLITHGSVIRAVIDYVYIALEGRGRIVVADASHNDADFDEVRAMAHTDEIQRFYRDTAGFEVEVYDLRPEKADKVDGVIVGHSPLPGGPAGYVKVNLDRHSAFTEIGELCRLLYGSEYDTSELHRHHNTRVHEYLISKSVLDADVVISVPKLKTHKKTGLTVNMKNLVGINGNKNWLPHHREGTPAQGGDQFPRDGFKNRFERSAVAGFKKVFPLLGQARSLVAGPIKAMGKRIFGDTNVATVRSGNWYGNDTTWRMVIDLNRILMYAGADGRLRNRPARRLFSVVDAIVGGEGNGPMDPTPRALGLIVAGVNPVAVDMVCARLMGFDYLRLPVLGRALDEHTLPLVDFTNDDIVCHSDSERFNRPLSDFEGACFAFRPHFGWKGHVEIDPVAAGQGA
jgi:uncharacterized protein (DUF362 family)